MDFQRDIEAWALSIPSPACLASLAVFLLTACAPAPARAQDKPCLSTPIIKRYRAECGPLKDDDVPKDPVRILADICPSDSVMKKMCEGRFGIPTGSGGAQVLSFHTVTFDPERKNFRVEWECPNWDGQVRVVVRIGEYVAGITAACMARCIEWPVERFRGYGIRRAKAMALVEIWNGNSPCRIPIHLVARLTVPRGLYEPDEPKCDVSGPAACLTVESNFARNAWEIGLHDVLLDSGRGRMGSRQYLIHKPVSCRPILLSVDFDRKANAKPTWIDELRF